MNIDYLNKIAAIAHYSAYEPFIFNGHTYGTNGVILVKLLHQELTTNEILPSFKNAIVNIDEDIRKATASFETNWVPLVDFFKEIPVVECRYCDGTGKVRSSTECPECYGDEELELMSDYGNYYTVECQTCGGSGEIESEDRDEECEDCNGTGVREETTYCLVGEDRVKFDQKYINLLCELPNAILAINRTPYKPSVVLFDGGEAVIMPCKG